MAAKKMKKSKMPASELFRRVESIVEKGTGIKKRVKKIEGLPRSAGAQRARVARGDAGEAALDQADAGEAGMKPSEPLVPIKPQKIFVHRRSEARRELHQAAKEQGRRARDLHRHLSMRVAIGLGLVAAVAFYLTTRPIMAHMDYTNRLALALLDGRMGIDEHPSWLNELIPMKDGLFTANYSIGEILSVMPFLFLSTHCLTALIAGACVFLFYLLSGAEETNVARRTMLALFPVFGTWMWGDFAAGGTYNITQGFGMIGQAGALYFTLVRPMPVIAGSFFALAFGNRTELILTLPIYLFLMKRDWRAWLRFLIVPVALGLLTAADNSARFGSPFEFGYNLQANGMNEPRCHEHGLFSIHSIAYNAYHMLFEGFIESDRFPFMQPTPWGLSIFLASPFLFLLFREGGRYKVAAWTAIGLVTAVLWCHCNQGGWQYSYRYAMTLLPWMFLLLAGNGPRRLTVNEGALFAASVAINGTAAWLYLWTDRIHV